MTNKINWTEGPDLCQSYRKREPDPKTPARLKACVELF